MERYQIELLLTVDNSANTLLNSAEKIVEMLKLNDAFRIYHNRQNAQYKITFQQEEFNLFVFTETENIYSVIVSTIPDQYDHMVLTGIFDSLTKVVREIKILISTNLKKCSYEVFWDDVGKYYANLAYPNIIKTENLMRKLITKFMMVSVGMDFFNNIPGDINIRNDSDYDSVFLHNIDFIDLTKYLFTERPLRKRDELMKIIDSLTKNELPKDVNLLDYQKDSYWNRYFKEVVGNGIDAASIKKDCELLYKLRCKVAHSKFLDKNECQKINDLCKNLNSTFTSALHKLNDIRLSDENKKTITEDIFSEIEGNVWHEKLYDIIVHNFQDEFTLPDLYRFEPLLKEQYPENNTIQASIRCNLQKLRDKGKIEFLQSGRYKVMRTPAHLPDETF